jgi:hypothetical protein
MKEYIMTANNEILFLPQPLPGPGLMAVAPPPTMPAIQGRGEGHFCPQLIIYFRYFNSIPGIGGR